MQEGKLIAFKIPIRMHTELKARLFYDEIPMTKFVRSYVEAYLNRAPLIVEFIKEYKRKNNIQNKVKIEKSEKLIEKGVENENLFNLTNKEVKDIYDTLEQELGTVEL